MVAARRVGAVQTLSTETVSLLGTAKHTFGAGGRGFVMAPSAHLFGSSLAGFSHSDIVEEGRQVD